MGLRMNNFIILGFTEKSDFYENQYRGGIAQKGGLCHFAGLKGGAWQERRGVFLREVWYPSAHYGKRIYS